MKNKMISAGLVLVSSLVTCSSAFAQEASGSASSNAGLMAIAAAIAIGIAALGGSLSQAKTASSALDAIGRNPAASGKVFLPWILSMVFIETLVIFSLVIALQLVGKM